MSKLEEIESNYKHDRHYLEYVGMFDFQWLINRVKKLEAALEFYNDVANIIQVSAAWPISYPKDSSQASDLQIMIKETARKALEE